MRISSSLAAFTVLLCATSGCVSSIEPDIDINASVSEDRPYYDALTKATRERTIFKDFETRYIMTATYLSPEFRSAFAARLEQVYKRGEPGFQEATAKAGFFITLNAPGGDDRIDLTNVHHWTVLLETKEGPIRPILIKHIDDKVRWRPFFPGVTNWSSEYLVIFDTPSVDANSPQMVAKTAVHLILANADAKVGLVW
jgi:hypothetical protein